jgi:hypothetical protein
MRIRLWDIFSIVLMTAWCCFLRLSWAQELVLVDFSKAQNTEPPGWELLVNKGDAQLRLISEAHSQVLQLRSQDASFGLQKKIHIPLQDKPFLVWQGKVTRLPTGGDFRTHHTDDQAAQLIVAFSSSRFLSYIWDSTVPKGIAGNAPAPPFRKILALVMQSGTQVLGTWITERRNLAQDYTSLFGGAPEALQGLRIQINSQHTHSFAESYWKSIMLTGQTDTAVQQPD